MKNLLLIFTCFALLSTSCKKDKDDPVITYSPGFGGNGEISAYVRYNDNLEAGARIYIKYGVDSFPTADTTLFDSLKVCGSTGHGLGHSHIKPLHKGKYYLYAVSYDSTLAQYIYGDAAVKLESEDDHEEITITLE